MILLYIFPLPVFERIMSFSLLTTCFLRLFLLTLFSPKPCYPFCLVKVFLFFAIGPCVCSDRVYHTCLLHFADIPFLLHHTFPGFRLSRVVVFLPFLLLFPKNWGRPRLFLFEFSRSPLPESPPVSMAPFWILSSLCVVKMAPLST